MLLGWPARRPAPPVLPGGGDLRAIPRGDHRLASSSRLTPRVRHSRADLRAPLSAVCSKTKAPSTLWYCTDSTIYEYPMPKALAPSHMWVLRFAGDLRQSGDRSTHGVRVLASARVLIRKSERPARRGGCGVRRLPHRPDEGVCHTPESSESARSLPRVNKTSLSLGREALAPSHMWVPREPKDLQFSKVLDPWFAPEGPRTKAPSTCGYHEKSRTCGCRKSEPESGTKCGGQRMAGMSGKLSTAKMFKGSNRRDRRSQVNENGRQAKRAFNRAMRKEGRKTEIETDNS